MLAAIDEKVLSEDSRFTFHDLRAFYASKHKRDLGSLPDLHANPETTARVYDRNKEVSRRSLSYIPHMLGRNDSQLPAQ